MTIIDTLLNVLNINKTSNKNNISISDISKTNINNNVSSNNLLDITNELSNLKNELDDISINDIKSIVSNIDSNDMLNNRSEKYTSNNYERRYKSHYILDISDFNSREFDDLYTLGVPHFFMYSSDEEIKEVKRQILRRILRELREEILMEKYIKKNRLKSYMQNVKKSNIEKVRFFLLNNDLSGFRKPNGKLNKKLLSNHLNISMPTLSKILNQSN